MVYLFLANGFETIEALAVVDMLRRAKIDNETVGVTGKTVKSSHNIEVVADITIDELNISNADAIVLPGGMPGTLNLEANSVVQSSIDYCVENKKYVCAICAAPSILGHKGLLKGRNAICFPGFEEDLCGAIISEKYVVSDGTTILGADDKAGIAQILEVEAVLRENKLDHAPLELLFTIAEEVGILGAFNVDTDILKGKIAYVLDGGGGPGVALIGGPDFFDIKGTIKGKAAHAGVSPEQGISSIQVMADAISHMRLLKVDEDTTTNIGRVICNYPTNVVPEITSFEMELDNRERKIKIAWTVTTTSGETVEEEEII